MKICLISDLHLSINPRLCKEAFFYEREGFKVVILVMWQSEDLLQRDMVILGGHNIICRPYLDIIPGHISSLARNLLRLRKRFAAELQKWLGLGTKWAISHAPEKMFKTVLDEDAELYSAHAECAFYVGRDLVKSGKKVIFDFEV